MQLKCLLKEFDNCFNLRSTFFNKEGEEKLALSHLPWKLFWSCSPKLYTSGENWNDAIKPEVVKAYSLISNYGQLKYVVNGGQRSWDEVERATDMYRDQGVFWPVTIMPVGADLNQQENNAAKISDEALRRGYNVASRFHVFVYQNEMGR